MTRFLLRAAVAALGLWLASRWVDGIHFADQGTLVIAALLLGLVNALLRPLIVLLTLPLTVLSLGLFMFVINALMLELVAALLEPRFSLSGFRAALLGAIVVGLAGVVGSWFIGPRPRVAVIVSRGAGAPPSDTTGT
ncbi:MAG: phage holin family protein [Proteobacteria bacterium]|nr:phage holin family protein [Pseudomonadota bacterium]